LNGRVSGGIPVSRRVSLQGQNIVGIAAANERLPAHSAGQ